MSHLKNLGLTIGMVADQKSGRQGEYYNTLKILAPSGRTITNLLGHDFQVGLNLACPDGLPDNGVLRSILRSRLIPSRTLKKCIPWWSRSRQDLEKRIWAENVAHWFRQQRLEIQSTEGLVFSTPLDANPDSIEACTHPPGFHDHDGLFSLDDSVIRHVDMFFLTIARSL